MLQPDLSFFYKLLNKMMFYMPMLYTTVICWLLGNSNSILVILINDDFFQLENIIISKYFTKLQNLPC